MQLLSSLYRGCLLLAVLVSGAPTLGAQPGSLDTSFDPGTGANATARRVEVLPDGSILLGGYFSRFNGLIRGGLVRLSDTAGVDADFNPGVGVDGGVLDFAYQSGGRLVIGGQFTSYRGRTRHGLARVLGNGQLDTSFSSQAGIAGTDTPVVYALAVQANDKVLVGGSFTSVNGKSHNHVARLEPDGQLDDAFNPRLPSDIGDGVYEIVALAGAKALIVGQFNRVDGVARTDVARLNPDGTLDTTFTSQIGSPSVVLAAAVQADDKILIAGLFKQVATVGRTNIARLNPDGGLDPDFKPGLGPNDQINAVAVQTDGKIVIAGYFRQYDGVGRNLVARLLPNGALDPTFTPGLGPAGGPDPGVLSVALATGGKVLIAGEFTDVGGIPRNRVARLHGNLPPPAPFRLESQGFGPDGQYRLNLSGEVGRPYAIQTSPDLAVWAVWTNFVCTTANTPLDDPSAMNHPTRYYRALTP